MSLCLSEILERVYAGQDGALEASHTDAEPAVQRPQLLQLLCFFRWARRLGDPALEGRPRVGVDADMLPVEPIGRMAGLAPARDGGARKIQRPAPCIGDDLDPGRIVHQRRVEWRGRRTYVVASRDLGECTGQGFLRQERFVTLHIRDRVEAHDSGAEPPGDADQSPTRDGYP